MKRDTMDEPIVEKLESIAGYQHVALVAFICVLFTGILGLVFPLIENRRCNTFLVCHNPFFANINKRAC
jgi:hypothetical protein